MSGSTIGDAVAAVSCTGENIVIPRRLFTSSGHESENSCRLMLRILSQHSNSSLKDAWKEMLQRKRRLFHEEVDAFVAATILHSKRRRSIESSEVRPSAPVHDGNASSVGHGDGEHSELLNLCATTSLVKAEETMLSPKAEPSEFSFACGLCDVGFKLEMLFREHLFAHMLSKISVPVPSKEESCSRNELKFKCCKCAVAYDSAADMYRHIESAHPTNFPCPYCCLRFASTLDLHGHVKRYHQLHQGAIVEPEPLEMLGGSFTGPTYSVFGSNDTRSIDSNFDVATRRQPPSAIASASNLPLPGVVEIFPAPGALVRQFEARSKPDVEAKQAEVPLKKPAGVDCVDLVSGACIDTSRGSCCLAPFSSFIASESCRSSLRASQKFDSAIALNEDQDAFDNASDAVSDPVCDVLMASDKLECSPSCSKLPDLAVADVSGGDDAPSARIVESKSSPNIMKIDPDIAADVGEPATVDFALNCKRCMFKCESRAALDQHLCESPPTAGPTNHVKLASIVATARATNNLPPSDQICFACPGEAAICEKISAADAAVVPLESWVEPYAKILEVSHSATVCRSLACDASPLVVLSDVRICPLYKSYFGRSASLETSNSHENLKVVSSIPEECASKSCLGRCDNGEPAPARDIQTLKAVSVELSDLINEKDHPTASVGAEFHERGSSLLRDRPLLAMDGKHIRRKTSCPRKRSENECSPELNEMYRANFVELQSKLRKRSTLCNSLPSVHFFLSAAAEEPVCPVQLSFQPLSSGEASSSVSCSDIKASSPSRESALPSCGEKIQSQRPDLLPMKLSTVLEPMVVIEQLSSKRFCAY